MTRPSEQHACHRCGLERTVKSGRTATMCDSCRRVEPDWPNVRVPSRRPVPRFYPDEADRVLRAINVIALEVHAAVEKRTRCCDVCGCLIGVWESCPKCALESARMGGAA